MGRRPCCRKPDGLKKGPWKAEEDEKLVSFISQHGHGNWQALPKKCGLLRCGKSCRLRWTNYLRPDIVRGGFTPLEDQKIVHFHGLVGNKWAFIASHLPKRTDNEIKNYWNTVLKKRLQKKLGLSAEAPIHSQISSTIETMFNTCTGNKQSLNHPTTNNTWQLPQQRTHILGMGSKSSGMDSAGLINQENAAKSANTYISIDTAMSSKDRITSESTAVSHLAQWDMARLQAEARLSCKQSTIYPILRHTDRPTSGWISCHSSSLRPNTSPLSTASANSTLIALQLSSSTNAIHIINTSGGGLRLATASQQQYVISMINDSQNDHQAGPDGVMIDGGLNQIICNKSGGTVYSSASENISPAYMASQLNDIGPISTDAGNGRHDRVKQEAGIINGEPVDQNMSDIMSDAAINDLQELLLDTASSAVPHILPCYNTSMEWSFNEALTPGVQQLKDALQDWLLNSNDVDVDDLVSTNLSFR